MLNVLFSNKTAPKPTVTDPTVGTIYTAIFLKAVYIGPTAGSQLPKTWDPTADLRAMIDPYPDPIIHLFSELLNKILYSQILISHQFKRGQRSSDFRTFIIPIHFSDPQWACIRLHRIMGHGNLLIV